jgi:hypothetical protein
LRALLEIVLGLGAGAFSTRRFGSRASAWRATEAWCAGVGDPEPHLRALERLALADVLVFATSRSIRSPWTSAEKSFHRPAFGPRRMNAQATVRALP